MTRRNDNLAAALRVALHENMKRINSAMPGEIVEYDDTTRLATVRGSLRMLLKNGEQVQRPVVRNAPVWFPEAGGYSIRYPLTAGDSVLLIFSQRGLDEWRSSHAESAPGIGPILSYRDAIVLAGFGPPPPAPRHPNLAPAAVEDALVLNGPGGYLAIKDDAVETDMDVTLKADTEVGTLPSAGEAYEGRMVHLRTSGGTELWFCRKDGATSWSWVELT